MLLLLLVLLALLAVRIIRHCHYRCNWEKSPNNIFFLYSASEVLLPNIYKIMLTELMENSSTLMLKAT